ncbi:hypothetical protein BAMA111019_07215 [Bacillus manliponensis]
MHIIFFITDYVKCEQKCRNLYKVYDCFLFFVLYNEIAGSLLRK